VQQIEAITLVSDMQTALFCLRHRDVVIRDGPFPLFPNSRFRVEDWDALHHEASRQERRFVLCSASVRALNLAHDCQVLALAKPTAIEAIYAAVMGFPRSGTVRGYRKLKLITECKASLVRNVSHTTGHASPSRPESAT
jgi:hypothetical protein